MKTRGIYYIATGESYYREAINSAKQVHSIMPDIPIAIATDIKEKSDLFVKQIQINDPVYNFGDKVENMRQSPFDETLFLDTDTYVVDNIADMFQLLERVDIAAPHAPIDEVVEGVPECFAEFNTGVVLFSKNEKVLKLFKDWQVRYFKVFQEDPEIPPDQPSFRAAVYYSDIAFTMLPHEYNCMLDYPVFLSSKVYVLHGHYDKDFFQEKVYELNSKEGCRVYEPQTATDG